VSKSNKKRAYKGRKGKKFSSSFSSMEEENLRKTSPIHFSFGVRSFFWLESIFARMLRYGKFRNFIPIFFK
jgi:hypothetical protein